MPLDAKALSKRGRKGGIASGRARNKEERDRGIRAAYRFLTSQLSGKLKPGTTQEAKTALAFLTECGHGFSLPVDETSMDIPPPSMNPVHFLAQSTGLTRKRIQQILKDRN